MEGGRQALVEQRAVGQAGQQVVGGLVGDLGLVLALAGDVLGDAEDPLGLALDDDRQGGEVEGAQLAVAMGEGELDPARLAGQGGPEQRLQARDVPRRQQCREVFAQHLRVLPSGDLVAGGVGGNHPPFTVEGEDAVRVVEVERAEALLQVVLCLQAPSRGEQLPGAPQHQAHQTQAEGQQVAQDQPGDGEATGHQAGAQHGGQRVQVGLEGQPGAARQPDVARTEAGQRACRLGGRQAARLAQLEQWPGGAHLDPEVLQLHAELLGQQLGEVEPSDQLPADVVYRGGDQQP